MSDSIHGSRNKLFEKPMKPFLIAPGELAPDFELNDIKGTPVRLSSFRGSKPLLLAFLRGFL
ncbi:MAG: redoxin domain-containing protein [Anaerolineales bacterium]|nr:redoxin domain-containing protein [Anaerolineales bacterium]